MSIWFASIDPSISCTAVSIIKYHDDIKKFELVDKVTMNLAKIRHSSRWLRKVDMYKLFEYYFKDRIESISFFVFENYSYGSVGHLADLGELNGMFKKYITDNNKNFDVIAPSSVKKIITGDGRATKEMVRDKVRDFIIDGDKIKFNNLDESDSLAIGVAYAIKMMEVIDGPEEDRVAG
jgi:crossover junction endodeoxyribonuclease RuvC